MIKLKQLLKQNLSKQQLNDILNKLKNGQDCSQYLLDINLPNSIYKRIIFDKNTNINIRDEFQGTALTNTCNENKIQKVKFLLSHPKINVNLQDMDEYSALMYACMRGNTYIVEMLLQNPKIDVNDSRTPPLLIARYHMQILKLLLQHPKIDVNIQNCVGETILIFACNRNDIQMVKILLSHPKIDVNIKDDNKKTAFDYTNLEYIKNLIKNHSSYISTK